MQGKIEWYNTEKGYGSILGESGETFFVHHKSVNRDEERFLTEGADVKFFVAPGVNGPQAINVEINN